MLRMAACLREKIGALAFEILGPHEFCLRAIRKSIGMRIVYNRGCRNRTNGLGLTGLACSL